MSLSYPLSLFVLVLAGTVARALGHPEVSAALVVILGVLTTAGCLPLLRRLHCRSLRLTGAAACGVLAVLLVAGTYRLRRPRLAPAAIG